MSEGVRERAVSDRKKKYYEEVTQKPRDGLRKKDWQQRPAAVTTDIAICIELPLLLPLSSS